MTGISSARARAISGLFGVDRARVDDDVGAVDVLRAWPTSTRTPSVSRRRVCRSASRSEPRHVELERAQDLGEAAHADAADADEVHVPDASAEHLARLRVDSCDAAPFVLRRGDLAIGDAREREKIFGDVARRARAAHARAARPPSLRASRRRRGARRSPSRAASASASVLHERTRAAARRERASAFFAGDRRRRTETGRRSRRGRRRRSRRPSPRRRAR